MMTTTPPSNIPPPIPNGRSAAPINRNPATVGQAFRTQGNLGS